MTLVGSDHQPVPSTRIRPLPVNFSNRPPQNPARFTRYGQLAFLGANIAMTAFAEWRLLLNWAREFGAAIARAGCILLVTLAQRLGELDLAVLARNEP